MTIAAASFIRSRPRQISPNDFNKHCAKFPRGRLIRRALTVRPMDTRELCSWAYPGKPVLDWMMANIIRAYRKWGMKQIGKRGRTFAKGRSQGRRQRKAAKSQETLRHRHFLHPPEAGLQHRIADYGIRQRRAYGIQTNVLREADRARCGNAPG